MKKQILLSLALIMSMMATAQVTIQMEKEGGVYKVPCTVNGVKMKFIFDTGAATVSMSQTMAQFLLDGDYLSESDIKGIGQSQLADGSIVNHATIVLRDVEIGGMHIHNIDATVIEGQNVPLLLGQSAIGKLGRISIEGNKLIIHSAESELTQQQISQLEEQATRYARARSYAAAIECYMRIDRANGLGYRLADLGYCYKMNLQFEECIQVCKRWLKEFETSSDNIKKESVYRYLADSYYYGLEDYNSALLWYQKALDLWENSDLSEDYSSYYSMMKKEKKAMICDAIGCCYCKLGNAFEAMEYYKNAIKLECQYLDVTMQDVQNGKVNEELLGVYLYDYSFCYYMQ